MIGLFGIVVAGAPVLAHGPTIELLDREKKPALLNLFVGTTVHFKAVGGESSLHVVVDEAAGIESPPIEARGDGWHYTFESEGSYDLFIREHPEAKARVVVVPKRGAPGASGASRASGAEKPPGVSSPGP